MDNTQKITSFRCENCGGTIKWNIRKQRLECGSCQTPFELPYSDEPVLEHDYEEYEQLEAKEVAFPEQEIISCSTCGAQIAFDAGRTASVCPMCGSSQVMESKQSAGVPPDGIIPFRIDKADAQQLFRKWVTSRWFAPNRLKQAYQEGRLDGIYLPFWTFDMEAEADYTGRGGTDHYYDDDETTTDWEKVSGHVDKEYDDIQICAASERFRDQISDVLPYSTQELTIPYNSAYLSGMAAERYSMTAEDALKIAQEQVEDDLDDEARREIERNYDKSEIRSLDVEYYNIGYKHILLPAWISAFGYGDKQYTYMINGETGKVTGERPYSIPKIIAAVIVAAIVAVILVSILGGCSASAESMPGEPEAVACAMEISPDQPLEESAGQVFFELTL